MPRITLYYIKRIRDFYYRRKICIILYFKKWAKSNNRKSRWGKLYKRRSNDTKWFKK